MRLADMKLLTHDARRGHGSLVAVDTTLVSPPHDCGLRRNETGRQLPRNARLLGTKVVLRPAQHVTERIPGLGKGAPAATATSRRVFCLLMSDAHCVARHAICSCFA